MTKPIFQEFQTYEQIAEWVALIHETAIKDIRFLKIETYWHLGRYIESHCVGEADSYTSKFIKTLSRKLRDDFSKKYTSAFLKETLLFYSVFPDWMLLQTTLSWAQYKILIRIEEEKARLFYTNEAVANQWSARQLNRQIKAKYYERFQQHRHPMKVPKDSKAAFIIKDLYILEFLNMANKHHYLEKELEDELVGKLQSFLMELGKGFAFVARQKRIVTASGKQFYIDLVFYHFIMKCFVLVELKVGDLAHRDIGQIHMYVRLFDEKWKSKEDNPTIGIIFCANKDHTIEKYSVMKDNPQLYAACYSFDVPKQGRMDEKVKAALERIEWLEKQQ